MATLHFVKKARKKNPVAKKGESYYWWKFRFGGKHYSKEAPPRSALTGSEYYGTVWDLQDNFELTSIDDAESTLQELSEEVQRIGEECQERLDNMPDQLQESDSGQMLQERVDACESCSSSIDSIDFEVEAHDEWIEDNCEADDSEDEKEEAYQNYIEEKLEEIRQEVEDALSELDV